MEKRCENAPLLVLDVMVDESEMCLDDCTGQFFGVILWGDQVMVDVIGRNWIDIMHAISNELAECTHAL